MGTAGRVARRAMAEDKPMTTAGRVAKRARAADGPSNTSIQRTIRKDAAVKAMQAMRPANGMKAGGMAKKGKVSGGKTKK